MCNNKNNKTAETSSVGGFMSYQKVFIVLLFNKLRDLMSWVF